MIVIGIDEVGRGCWAGPLVAAAAVLDPLRPIEGLHDSKQLRATERQRLAGLVHEQALAVGVGWVWPEQVDATGLTNSVAMAMKQAIDQVLARLALLGLAPDEIIIDGSYNFLPQYATYAKLTTLVKADGLVPTVSAASIVAKVARDTYMAEVAATNYPAYGFDKHVGYGTAQHIAALGAHGVTPIHRRSYKPIQAFLLQSGA